MVHPRLLTVAGAAQEFTWFPFNLTEKNSPSTLNVAGYYHNQETKSETLDSRLIVMIKVTRLIVEITFGTFCYQLTWQGFSNYSAQMEAELKSLEEKINQFVQLSHRQRSENIQLRQQLANATSENKHLSEKINTASSRLETLLTQINGNK